MRPPVFGCHLARYAPIRNDPRAKTQSRQGRQEFWGWLGAQHFASWRLGASDFFGVGAYAASWKMIPNTKRWPPVIGLAPCRIWAAKSPRLPRAGRSRLVKMSP